MVDDPQVRERRTHARYTFEFPIAASWGGSAVAVVDISARGLQLEHADPLRLHVPSRISVPYPDSKTAVELRGEVVWSRLSKKPNAAGKYLYRSGVKLEDTAETDAAVQSLLAAYQPRIDSDSLERKRHHLKHKRESSRRLRPLKIYRKSVDSDRVLLIRQIHDRLKQNPEELSTLAGRARSALSVRIDSVVHTDEALAVWEYLQRVISLDEIREVLSAPR